MKWNDGRWVFFLLLLSSLYWYFEFLNRVHCGPLFVDCYGECRHDTPFFLYSHLWKNIRTDQRSQRADTYRSAGQHINNTKGSVNYYANFVSTFFSYFRFWCKMKEMGLFFKRHLKRYHSVHRVVEDTINTVA